MPTLTQPQAELLAQAADGDLEASPETKKTAAALVKRGLLISIPTADGPSRLTITSGGREALAPSESSAPEDEPPVEAEPIPPAAEESAGSGPEATESAAAKEPKGKIQILLGLLRRPEGARVEEMMAATGWQKHSVRGAMSGAIKKNLGIEIGSEKTDAGRVYRIGQGGAA